jgi:hypothetical protein
MAVERATPARSKVRTANLHMPWIKAPGRSVRHDAVKGD